MMRHEHVCVAYNRANTKSSKFEGPGKHQIGLDLIAADGILLVGPNTNCLIHSYAWRHGAFYGAIRWMDHLVLLARWILKCGHREMWCDGVAAEIVHGMSHACVNNRVQSTGHVVCYTMLSIKQVVCSQLVGENSIFLVAIAWRVGLPLYFAFALASQMFEHALIR